MQEGTITCKNCSQRFEGKYCNQCGEKVFSEHDKSFLHLLEEGFHFITHFEGKFFTTLRALFKMPGQLSLDYCSGIRKKYFRPLSFFLMLVILYLLFPLYEGLNMPLRNYTSMENYFGAYASGKVEAIMQKQHSSFAQVSQQYHAVSEKVSKFLLFILIPLSALVLQLLARRQRKPFYDHFVLATEINSFLILSGYLLLGLLVGGLYLLGTFFHWQAFLRLIDNEGFAMTIGGLAFIIFLAAAIERFYGYGRGRAILYALLFMAVQFTIVILIYRAILFTISTSLIR